MDQEDTICLLRECDAGIKMGLSAIQEVKEYAHNPQVAHDLENRKKNHEKLEEDMQILLNQYHDDGKEPNPMAKSMSWVKTNMKLAMEQTDETIADLIVDGCHMGIKSLHKYINKYPKAKKEAIDITQRLIKDEEELAKEMYPFL